MGNCIFFFKIQNKNEKKYLSATAGLPLINESHETIEPI